MLCYVMLCCALASTVECEHTEFDKFRRRRRRQYGIFVHVHLPEYVNIYNKMQFITCWLTVSVLAFVFVFVVVMIIILFRHNIFLNASSRWIRQFDF